MLVAYSGLPEPVVARIPFPGFDFKVMPEQLDVWQKLMVGQGLPVGKLDMKSIVVTPGMIHGGTGRCRDKKQYSTVVIST